MNHNLIAVWNEHPNIQSKIFWFEGETQSEMIHHAFDHLRFLIAAQIANNAYEDFGMLLSKDQMAIRKTIESSIIEFGKWRRLSCILALNECEQWSIHAGKVLRMREEWGDD